MLHTLLLSLKAQPARLNWHMGMGRACTDQDRPLEPGFHMAHTNLEQCGKGSNEAAKEEFHGPFLRQSPHRLCPRTLWMPEEEMGSKRYSSKLLKNIPSCMGETHPIHAILCGSSMEVHITSTPTTSFTCKSSTATGPAMFPYPCASSRRNQHYVSEGACPNYRLPCQMWERAALDPNTCYIRVHSYPSLQDKPQVTSFDSSIEGFAHLALQPFA